MRGILDMRAFSRKQELWSSCKSELGRRRLDDESYVVRLERETQLLTEEDAMLFLFTRQCIKKAGIRACDTNIRGTFANSLISYLLGISELDPVKVGVSHLFFLDKNHRKVIDINIPMSFEDSLIKVARRLLIDGWGEVFYEVEKDNCIWGCESVTSRSSLIFQNFKVLDKIQEKLKEKNMKVQDIPLDNQTIASFFEAEKGKVKHPYPFEHEYPAMILDDIEFSINSLNDLAKIMGLMHGSNIWLENMRPIICGKKISVNEAISSRDDVLTILMNAGCAEDMAFKLSYWVYTGKQAEGQEWKAEANKIKKIIPRWQFDCFSTVKYLFPHMHSLSYALASWRWMWLESLDEV